MHPSSEVVAGERAIITARLLNVTITEPVKVVAVVEGRDQVGFPYRTLPGHPVNGEEAFIVHRTGEEVHLIVRSLPVRPMEAQGWDNHTFRLGDRMTLLVGWIFRRHRPSCPGRRRSHRRMMG